MRAAGSCILLIAALVLLAAVGPSNAILHRDQVGKWDWFNLGVGFVEHAAIVKSKTNKVAYVASKSGTVTALRTRNEGFAKWRKVFSESDEFVCLALKGDSIVAATKAGKVISLKADTGMIQWTNQLVLEEGAEVETCAAPKSGTVLAVVRSGATAVELHTVKEESVTPATKKPIDVKATVTDIKCSQEWCWVAAGGKVSAFSTAKQALVVAEGITGVASISGVDGAVAAVHDGKKAVLLKATESKIATKKTVKCEAKKTCSASIVSDSDSDDVTLLVVAAGEGKAVVSVDGDDVATVELNEVRDIAPVALAAAGGKKTEILLRTTDGHLHYVIADSVSWTRNEGLSTVQFTKFGELPDTVEGQRKDGFGFNELIFFQSKHGRIFAVETLRGKNSFYWSQNVFVDIAQKFPSLDAKTIIQSEILNLMAEGEFVEVTIRVDGNGYILKYESITGILIDVTEFKDLHRTTGHLMVSTKGVANVKPTNPYYLYEVNKKAGTIQGFTVGAGKNTVEKTWSVNIGAPITSTADGHNPLATSSVEGLRVIPNMTAKGSNGQVRRKYPTHNILAVSAIVEDAASESEFPSLEITLLDTITGSVLSKGTIENVDGTIPMIIVEHALIFHYLDVKKMRYVLGVWELLEMESHMTYESTMVTPGAVITSFFSSGKRSVSSFAQNPPHVVAQNLAFQTSEVVTMGTTTSFYGVARKQVLFGTASGRVVSVALNNILHGGQMNPAKPGSFVTYVQLPPVNFITHDNVMAHIKHITSTPTQLESSSHTISVGQDIFYIRLSSGKAFDLLNDDFNFNNLIIVLAVFAIASVVLHDVARSSALKLAWA